MSCFLGPRERKEVQRTKFLPCQVFKSPSLLQNNLSNCQNLQPSQIGEISPEFVPSHGANLAPGAVNMMAEVTAWLQIRLAASLHISRPTD
jgi:hypothetical protein